MKGISIVPLAKAGVHRPSTPQDHLKGCPKAVVAERERDLSTACEQKRLTGAARQRRLQSTGETEAETVRANLTGPRVPAEGMMGGGAILAAITKKGPHGVTSVKPSDQLPGMFTNYVCPIDMQIANLQ